MADNASGKRRGLAANSFFSVVAWVFPIIVGFVSTPILVRNLGSEQYGLLAVILGFISYSFAFGVGKVAGKYVPEFQTAGEHKKVTQVIAATFWISLAIGLVGSSALALSAEFIVRDVLLISPETQSTAIRAFYLAGAVGVVMMLSQVFQYVLQGLHRFDNYATLTNLYGVMMGVGNIILVLNGIGVVGLLVWNVLVISFVGFLFYVRASRLLPSLRLFVEIPRSMVTTVIRYAGSIVLYQVFGNVLLIFERAWVTRKFGADGLTYYFVPMLIALYMHGFVASIVQSVFPAVNEILENRVRVAELYRRANKIALVIVVFVVTNFIVCGYPFLAFWISPELADQSYPLLVAHGLTFGAIAIAIMAFQLADAFEFPGLNAILTGSWLAVAIPLMIVAGDIWQLAGVAWARAAAALVTVPLTIYVEHRFLGEVQWRFWTAVGARLGLAAGAMAIVEWLVLSSLSNSLASLIVAGVAGSLAFAAVLAVTGFVTSEEKAFIRNSIFRKPVAESPGGIPG